MKIEFSSLEEIEQFLKLAKPTTVVPGKDWEPPTSDTIARLCDVCRQLSGGNKIGAIKAIREWTGLGLKEAKDIVEGSFNVLVR